jgi:hypothetical protein
MRPNVLTEDYIDRWAKLSAHLRINRAIAERIANFLHYEIQHDRKTRHSELLNLIKDIQHNVQVMNQAEPSRVWAAIDDLCRAAIEKDEQYNRNQDS